MLTCCPACGLQKLNAEKNNESALQKINANSFMLENMQKRIDTLEARTKAQDDAFQNLHTVVPNVLNNLVGINGNHKNMFTKIVSNIAKNVTSKNLK